LDIPRLVNIVGLVLDIGLFPVEAAKLGVDLLEPAVDPVAFGLEI
jgi:hypothetical protein